MTNPASRKEQKAAFLRIQGEIEEKWGAKAPRFTMLYRHMPHFGCQIAVSTGEILDISFDELHVTFKVGGMEARAGIFEELWQDSILDMLGKRLNLP